MINVLAHISAINVIILAFVIKQIMSYWMVFAIALLELKKMGLANAIVSIAHRH